jgi:hypothetical protein
MLCSELDKRLIVLINKLCRGWWVNQKCGMAALASGSLHLFFPKYRLYAMDAAQSRRKSSVKWQIKYGIPLQAN